MASILGIVGSARRWGNSELMVRQVLRGAQAGGASAQMVRLTALELEPCTGCMRCAIGGKPCPLDDDMAWLVDVVQSADALVLSAPTYFLGPAAVVKLVLDRLLMVTSRTQESPSPVRPAVTVITAGLEDWRGVGLPYLNALVAAFGYRPIESLTAVAPGPGEVLLNDDLMAQALAAGQRLGRSWIQALARPEYAPCAAATHSSCKGTVPYVRSVLAWPSSSKRVAPSGCTLTIPTLANIVGQGRGCRNTWNTGCAPRDRASWPGAMKSRPAEALIGPWI